MLAPVSAIGFALAVAADAPLPVVMPGAAGRGIGFDDLAYAPALDRVIVPAGATRKVQLLDPKSHAISATLVLPPAAGAAARGGHGDGVTSAVYDDVHRVFVAGDRTKREVDVFDGAGHALLSSTPLAAGPDYVRVLPKAGLVWVTEPGREQIEVFALDNDKKLTRVRSFTVSGGPESLVVDEAAGRAYTNTWHGDTLAIDVAKESVVATWPNGCKSSRGLALDREAHLVYVGCDEGRVSALDAASGAVKGSVQAPVHDVDIIAFDEKLRHVYVPGDRKMAIVGAAKTGALSVLATVPTAPDAHCVVADGRGQAWVCAPEKGRVLVVKDSAPAM